MSLAYHYKLAFSDFKEGVNSIFSNSRRVQLALRTALACVTSIFLANFLCLDFPFWSGITSFVMLQPNIGASLQKGWMRGVATIVGVLFSLFFLNFFIQSFFLFGIFAFLGMFIAYYNGNKGKHKYFWFYSMATMVLLGYVETAIPTSNFAIHIGFMRCAELWLGIIVSSVYVFLLWPRFAGNEFKKAFETLLKSASEYYVCFISDCIDGKIECDELAKFKKDIDVHFASCLGLIDFYDTEKSFALQKTYELKNIISLFEHRVKSLERIIEFASHEEKINIPEEYKSALLLLKNWFPCIVNSKKQKSAQKLLNDFKRVAADKNVLKKTKNLSTSELYFLLTLLKHLNSGIDDFLFYQNAQEMHYNKNRVVGKEKIDESDYFNLSIYSFNYSLHIPSFWYAVKGAFSFVVIFVFFTCLNLPTGTVINMGVALIAVTGSQTTETGTIHKFYLRLMGCFIGAAFALFVLSLSVDSATFYFSALFLCSLLFAYIYTMKAGIAYVGLQAAIVFVMCVAGENYMAGNFNAGLERLLAIGISLIVSFIIYFVLFPGNHVSMLKKRFINLRKFFTGQCDFLANLLKGNKIFLNENSSSDFKYLDITDFKMIISSINFYAELSEDEEAKTFKFLSIAQSIADEFVNIHTTSSEAYIFLNKIYYKEMADILLLLNKMIKGAFDAVSESDLKLYQYETDLALNKINSVFNSLNNKKLELKMKLDLSNFFMMLRQLLSDSLRLVQSEFPLKI